MRPQLEWLERHATRAGIRSEKFWDQTERATLLEIQAHTWRWRRKRRLYADLVANLMNVSGKVLESPVTGAALLGLDEHENGKGWAEGAYFFFRMAEHYEG